MRRLVTKPTKWHVRPAKTQISLGIRPVWSEPSLCAQLVAKDPSFLDADSGDSDQTGRMPRLIWVFAGRTCHFIGFVMRWLKWLTLIFEHSVMTNFNCACPSHSEGPGIWLSVWRFLLIRCLYERAAKVLARLRGCAGSPEPSLLA